MFRQFSCLCPVQFSCALLVQTEARLPKLVGVIASDVGSNASDDRSEFTQAHTRSIASKMLWHIAWNCQELCIPNCLLNPKEIPRVFVKKKSPSDQLYTLNISPQRTVV